MPDPPNHRDVSVGYSDYTISSPTACPSTGEGNIRMHAERGVSLIEFDGATVTIQYSMPLKARAIQRFALRPGGSNVR